MKSTVSVIIPTYKRADYLKRAIDSVLNQTYSDIEIIVVDDNDPDTVYRKKTEQIMEKYLHYSNIQYIKHQHNCNGAVARNTGLTYASGEYICFLDDDDWYLADKVERQLNYLKKHGQFAAVYCGYERDGKRKNPHKEGDLSFEILSGIETIYTNTIMMRRENALSCGGWDERFRRNQEAVFLLRYFACGGLIGAIPDLLVQFDISDASNRSNPIQSEEDFRFFLDSHEQEIQKCKERYQDARDMIYSYRYRGILLNYIKYGYFKEAFFLFCDMNRKYPKRFRKDCCTYVKRRLLKIPLYEEFEEKMNDENDGIFD